MEVYQTSARKNPGAVGDTLAWERQAQLDDAKAKERIAAYRDVVDGLERRCYQRVRQERGWFSDYAEAHATGATAKDINWDRRGLDLVGQCEQEKNGVAPPSIPEAQPGEDAPPAPYAGSVFACSLGDEAVYVSETDGRYTYRYGKSGAPELTLIRQADELTSTHDFGTLDGIKELRFDNGEYSYVLFFEGLSDNYGTDEAYKASGLRVMRQGKMLSERHCTGGIGFAPDWFGPDD
ncbi:hypothetical protein [Altericroceibacterium endophyticum]|uniref:Uncharacterized protein n=1 Tax=Altericroceibacterium endophyticum TaxID=1808508 RepID=A0A6I4T987_9SPHN|nr:hypothetical protein [Altericroceibacterium endophyticum]MXO66711.1 hypothetical protein [Altericroceibacterium endophyticum]